MKTKILTLAIVFSAVLSISNFAYANSAVKEDYTVLNDIKTINKIEVRGNVELFISDSSVEQVKVYNKYYAESAFLQYRNGVLRISSYNPKKLIVWVSTDELNSITAYDNAVVRSFGKLSKIEFAVELHNNATASLNIDAYSAGVTLKDHARIELIGTADEFNINHSSESNVSNKNFFAAHYNDNRIAIESLNNTELAGLE